MMARINRIPTVGDRPPVGGFRFEVVDMDGRRVDRVLIVPPKPNGPRNASAYLPALTFAGVMLRNVTNGMRCSIGR